MSTREQKQAEAWATVELDEFHPDPRVAAAFADLKANAATQAWLEKEARRLAARIEREPLFFSKLETERQHVERLLAQVKAEAKGLEEVAAQWLPSKD